MIAASFLIGLLGGAHCIGMCGPLVMLLQANKGIQSLPFVLYQLGRWTSYAAIGSLFFFFGKSTEFMGVQQYFSLIFGVLLIVILLLVSHPEKWLFKQFDSLGISKLLRQLYQKHHRPNAVGQQYILGMLNGFLPCGLVYAAALLTINLAHYQDAIIIMIAFGAGTLPALMGVSFFKQFLGKYTKNAFKWSLAIVALMLILRGANLDIPYISPAVDEGGSVQCHQ